MIELLFLLLLLQIKHFLIDFVNQTNAEIKGKAVLGNIYGIAHSTKHAFATFICFVPFCIFYSKGIIAQLHGVYIVGLFLAELLTHYAIDYIKSNATTKLKLAQDKKGYWVAFGLDQLLHQLTYLAIALYVFRGIL